MADPVPQTLPPELLAELQRLELLRLQGKLPPVAQPAYARSANSPAGDLMAQITNPDFGRSFDQTGQFLSSVSPPQAAIDATDKLATAMGKPTLPNITDAAVGTALGLGQFGKAAKAMAGGFGMAGASDLFDSAARAQTAKTKQAPPAGSVVKMPGLDDAQNARANELLDKLAKSQFANGAERRSIEDELKGLRDISQGFVRRNQESANRIAETEAANKEAQRAAEAKRKGEEDAAARGRANAAYAEGLSTQRKFSDTTTGQMFDKFGPVAPGAVAAGTGAMTGAGMRGMGVTGKLPLYGVPAALGTLAGVGAAHWPQAYEANYAPNVNPSYQAAQNYIREAPVGDPRAAQLKGLLDDNTIPKENPVRTEAEKNLYDPTKFKERSLLGAFEGLAGGLIGGETMPAIKYLLKNAPSAASKVGEIPGATVSGVVEGLGPLGKRFERKPMDVDALRQRAEADIMAARINADREQALKYYGGQDYRGSVDQALRAKATPTPDLMGQPASPVPAAPPPAAVAPSPVSIPPPTQVPMPTIPGPANAVTSVPAELTGSSGSSKIPRMGPWQQTWSDPARDIIEKQVASGGSIGPTGMTADKLRTLIGDRLPPGSKLPSESLVSERLARLRLGVGQNPSMENLKQMYELDPYRVVFGLPAAAYVGSQMMPSDLMGPSY